jgi:hypothetical protein
LDFPSPKEASEKWLESLKKGQLNFVNVDAVLNSAVEKTQKHRNYTELAVIQAIVDHFLECGIQPG